MDSLAIKLSGIMQQDDRIGWPSNRKQLKELPHGWFRPGNREVLERLMRRDMRIIVELGSWLGTSTKFICESNPDALVFAIDIWSNEYFLTDDHYNKSNPSFKEILDSNPIYDQFLSNLEKFKYKIPDDENVTGLVPMKMDSVEALNILHKAGFTPDLIYVDASHHYDFVVKDLNACLDLFPDAVIVGDDWDNQDVRRAVQYIMKQRNLKVYVRRGSCWTFEKDKIEAIFMKEEKEQLEEAKEERKRKSILDGGFKSVLGAYKVQKSKVS